VDGGVLEGDTKGNSGSAEKDEWLVDANGSGCGALRRRCGRGSSRSRRSSDRSGSGSGGLRLTRGGGRHTSGDCVNLESSADSVGKCNSGVDIRLRCAGTGDAVENALDIRGAFAEAFLVGCRASAVGDSARRQACLRARGDLLAGSEHGGVDGREESEGSSSENG